MDGSTRMAHQPPSHVKEALIMKQHIEMSPSWKSLLAKWGKVPLRTEVSSKQDSGEWTLIGLLLFIWFITAWPGMV